MKLRAERREKPEVAACWRSEVKSETSNPSNGQERRERVVQRESVAPRVCLTHLFSKQEAHEDTPLTGQLDNFIRDVTQVCEKCRFS